VGHRGSRYGSRRPDATASLILPRPWETSLIDQIERDASADSGPAQPQDSGFWKRWRRIGTFVVGLVSIVGVVIAVIEAL
jgi:hypothetical protein